MCHLLGVAQMRLCMDQENYPHDFMTALVPAPVPDDEKYNTEFYRKQTVLPVQETC